MLSIPFLRSAPFFPPTHLIEGDMTVSYTVNTLFFPTMKLKSLLRDSSVLSDTRIFSMPFLENMTLRISFIVGLFLFGKWITAGQPAKEFTGINRNPTPVMYAWSICTRLHGSSSLGHEYKVVCVRFLNSLHFFTSFYIFFDISWISQPLCS